MDQVPNPRGLARQLEYGTCQLAEGAGIDGRSVVIVEDVVTTGGQLIESAKALRTRGALVTDAVCVIDREANGVALLAAEGIRLHGESGAGHRWALDR